MHQQRAGLRAWRRIGHLSEIHRTGGRHTRYSRATWYAIAVGLEAADLGASADRRSRGVPTTGLSLFLQVMRFEIRLNQAQKVDFGKRNAIIEAQCASI